MAKTASIIHFHMGDSYLTTLAQEQVGLARAMENYDYVILLKHDVDAGPFELSRRAERHAHEHLEPTKENLVRSIKKLTEGGFEIDLFVFAHGKEGAFTVSAGKDPHKAKYVTAEWLGKQLGPDNSLRMVWQCNCYGASLNEMWLEAGAQNAVGTVGVNFYPTRFKRFAKMWGRTHNPPQAVVYSESAFTRGLTHAYIQADAVAKGYGEVLTDSDRAEVYFEHEWNVVLDAGESGIDAMKQASRQVLSIKPAKVEDAEVTK